MAPPRRAVRFSEDAEYDDDATSKFKRVPTPRFLKARDPRLPQDPPSDESGEDEPPRRPAAGGFSLRGMGSRYSRGPYPGVDLKRRSKRTSNSDSSEYSRHLDLRKAALKKERKAAMKQKLDAILKQDGRSSLKERKRRSELARSLPRTPDGKFMSRYAAARAASRDNPEHFQSTPPSLRRLEKEQQKDDEEEEDGEESFMKSTPPKLPQGRYIKELVQTPGNLYSPEKLSDLIESSVEKGVKTAMSQFQQRGLGTRLNFDDVEEEEEIDGNKNRTPPRRRRDSRSRM